MGREIKLGNRAVGDGHPAYVIAEIGINHNGDLDIAKQIIDAAAHAGADAVKFQKRTPEVATPPDQQKQMRDTPWGYITYLEYRYKVEFSEEQYREIDRYCKEKKIDYVAGCALFADNPRGKITGDLEGVTKLVVDANTRKVLGVHVIGERASELVHIGQTAITLGATVDVFIEMVFNYPTLADSYKYAAYECLGALAKRATH